MPQKYKNIKQNLQKQKKQPTFAPLLTKSVFTLALRKQRRDGRVVDYSSLENYRTERYRGFESLSLRTLNEKPAGFSGLFLFIKLESVGGILSSTLKKAQCHLENR